MMGVAVAKKRRGRPVIEERVGATLETAAKLEQDPLFAVLQRHGEGGAALERAAGEIQAIYYAVCRGVMGRAKWIGAGAAGRYEMPDGLAFAHADRYLPWTIEWRGPVIEATFRLLIEREPVAAIYGELVVRALADYARRMMGRAERN